MGLRPTIPLMLAAITLAGSVVASTAQAFPSSGGTETAQVNTPADGTAAVSTDTLPANATQADVTVTPLTDEQFFGKLRVALGTPIFDFAERVEACVGVTEAVIKNPNFFPTYTIPRDRTLQLLFLSACLQTALEVSLQPANQARDARAGCAVATQFMSLKISHSSAGYSGQVSPTARRIKLKSRVRMTCQRTARGLRLKIRPLRRGQKLRSTVGRTLQLGVANPTKAPVRLKVAFTVK